MDAFVRKFNVDGVVSEGAKDVAAVMGCMKVQNMSNLLDNLTLTLCLDLDEHMLGSAGCRCRRGVVEAGIGNESRIRPEEDSVLAILRVAAG